MVAGTTLKRAAAGLLAICIATAAPAQPQAGITADEIVQKNAAARGGPEAWKKVQTMAWAGHVIPGNAPGQKLPFVLEQKRPDHTRFELMTDGKRSIRLYDGRSGWKLRVNAGSGRPELVPFTEDELKFARGAQIIDGPLMDYAARGGAISFGGYASAEGRKAYVLDVKLPSGGNHRVWVDAETFLEARLDRQVRGGTGQMGVVTILFREYRDFEGLKLPTSIETGAGPGGTPNRLVIERVALNPTFDDRMFAKPDSPVSRRTSIVVDTREAAAAGQGLQAPPP